VREISIDEPPELGYLNYTVILPILNPGIDPGENLGVYKIWDSEKPF